VLSESLVFGLVVILFFFVLWMVCGIQLFWWCTWLFRYLLCFVLCVF